MPRLLGRTALDHEENPPLYGLRIRSNWLCQRTGKNGHFEIEECACTQRYVERVHIDVQDQNPCIILHEHGALWSKAKNCACFGKLKPTGQECMVRAAPARM